MVTTDEVMQFFRDTAESGPLASGEWRDGLQLYQEFMQWGGGAALWRGRAQFYADLRDLGFAETRSPQVQFFAPKRLSPDHARSK